MASDSLSITSFTKDKKKAPMREGRPRWWEPERWKGISPSIRDSTVANSVHQTVDGMQKRQSARIRELVTCARLYGNSSLAGMSGVGVGAMASPLSLRERLTDNVIGSVIDTSTARVGENKPRPYYLTDGGSYKAQRQAKKLNKLTQAILYETKAYRMGSDAQRDAEIFGDGLILVSERFGRIHHERVLSAELWVDEAEAVYGKPRQLHWHRAIDREVLIAWVEANPNLDSKEAERAKEATYTAQPAPLQMEGFPANSADMVSVVESWHLPSGPEAKDGRHCISIEGCLIDPLTEWNHDFFPFARWKWSPRPLGYWSQGLAAQLMSKQLEINKLLWLMQRSMHMAGTYKVLLEDGSKIVSEHINNEIGAIVKYKGTKPDWFVPNVVPVEYYQQYERIVASCYERANVPIQAATGQKPPGLNSGEAQRVYRDTTNEGMKTKEGLNEEAFMELAKLDIALAREIALRDGYYEAKYPTGRSLETVRIKAAELDPSNWEMQCFPTSSLPKDPGGRIQTITEYMQAGFLTQRQGRKLLDFPDLEANESLANSAEDLIAKTLDAICDEGEYVPPEPTDDLMLASEMVVEYINRGRAQGLEEDRLDLLRTWQVQVETLKTAAMPPPPPALPAGPPMAPPEAMAPSPLVPQVPMAA